MPVTTTTAPSILSTTGRSSLGVPVKEAANRMRYNTQNSPDAAIWSTAGEAFGSVQRQLDQLYTALQQPLSQTNPVQVVDSNGNLIAEMGDFVDASNNVAYEGIWGTNLWIGGKGPATAQFFSNGKIVAIGQNGQVYVLDPYGNVGAWLGTQSEASQNVSGAVAATGKIRLTVTAHGYRNGDWVNVASVGGVPNATGQWVISVFDANHFDLLGSTFGGSYTSGGTVNRFFAGGAFETVAVAAGQRITNVVNNGSGLCRVTITAHGYATGYAVVVTNVQGVPGANGNFLVTVIDANTFDLQGSVFTGSYVSGGISINWPTAKLLAQGDGSLLLQNAVITSVGGGSETLINSGQIIVGPAGNPASAPNVQITQGDILIVGDSTNGYEINIASSSSASAIQIIGNSTSLGDSEQITLTGYTGSTAFGPIITFTQSRGTATSPTATQSGDTLGGFTAIGTGGGMTVQVQATAASATTSSFLIQGGSGTLFTFTDAGELGIGVTPTEFIHGKLSQNGVTRFLLQNATAGANAQTQVRVTNDVPSISQLGIFSSSATPYGMIAAGDANVYANTNLDLMADGSGKVIRFATNGSSEVARFTPNGGLNVGATADPGAGIINANSKFSAAGTAGEASLTITYLTGTPGAGQSSKTVTFTGGIETAHT